MKRENAQVRLNLIMSERNLRQVDILNLSKPWQEKLGIKLSKNHISNYVHGVSNPDQQKTYLLAKTLGVSEPWIMGYDVPKYPNVSKKTDIESKIDKTVHELKPPRQETVLDCASDQLDKQKSEEYFEKNTMDMFTLEDYKSKVKTVTLDFYDDPASAGTGYYLENDKKSTVTLPLFAVPDRSDFVITIAGDSMEPKYHDKDYVFVQQTFDVFEGDIGIFVVDGESYIKELRDENGKICLHSLNEEYEDRIIEESQYFRVVGKVIGRYAD